MTQRKEHSLNEWDYHDSDRCAAVFIISFVLTVFLSLRHVADILSWLLHVLTHADVRPTLDRSDTVTGSNILIYIGILNEILDFLAKDFSERIQMKILLIPYHCFSTLKLFNLDLQTTVLMIHKAYESSVKSWITWLRELQLPLIVPQTLLCSG
jgi:hypothetical protein